MSLKTARRIAAQALGAGEARIRFKPDSLTKASEALTREDIRGLVKDGGIYALPQTGQTRLRGQHYHAQRKKGRKLGRGNKKGKMYSRVSQKEDWMLKVRAQRAYLAKLKEEKKIESADARHIYLMIKGRAFRGRSALEAHLREKKIIK
jgi:large subunit ribosomal protein L19e